MRKIAGIITLIFCASAVFAQSDDGISVASFTKLENDLTARTQKKIDQNGEPCALIKVSVQGDGFIFEGDGLGIVTTVPKINEGEYWVYVPRGAKYLTIKHKTFGVLRQYAYPVKIEKQCTYEMKVSHKKVETEGNYLIMSVKPEESTIYIDGEKLDAEIKSPFLSVGNHAYRVECENYVTQSGQVTISKAERSTVNVMLTRAMGFITINYQPEGADIYIDDKLMGKTPLRVRLESGEHSLTLKKDLYTDENQNIKITQDCDIQLSGELKKIPSGFVKVRTNARGASIYIDDKLVGKTRGVFEVLTGNHTVRVSKPGWIEKSEQVMVKAGQTHKVVAKEPKPESQKNMSASEKREQRNAEKQEARERERIEKEDARNVERQQNYEERVGKRYMDTGIRGFIGGGLHFTLDAIDFKNGIQNDDTNTDQMKHPSLVGTGAQVSASFGNNVKPFWYMGVGCSYIFTATGTSRYCWSVPIFLDNRIEAFNRKNSPFVALRLGAGLPYLTENSSYNAGQFYMSPSVGMRIDHLNVMLSFTNRMAVKDKDFKTPRTLSVGVMYDFGGRKK
jgi:hypothetical protein